MTAATEDKILQGPIEGRYGQWYLRESDAAGVQTYRVALSTMCALNAVALGLSLADLQTSPLLYDALYFGNLAAFYVALQTIHIYAKPLHQALKALWWLSLAASLGLEVAVGGGLVNEVVAKPALLLGVGWQFVALTGLFIKEAFCFQRTEALALIALVPLLSGGHFLGLAHDTERLGGLAFVALFAIFCVRKLTQDKVDDIGDMSVFEHLEKGGSL